MCETSICLIRNNITTYKSEKRKKYEIGFIGKTTLFRRDFQTLNARYEQQELPFLQMFISFSGLFSVFPHWKHFIVNGIELQKLDKIVLYKDRNSIIGLNTASQTLNCTVIPANSKFSEY